MQGAGLRGRVGVVARSGGSEGSGAVIRYFRVGEEGNSTGGGGRKRENEKESERTYSSVGKSADTYFPGFTHIIYVFFYFRKSPLKDSILPERHFKAISIF
jgi:hypothetical protein